MRASPRSRILLALVPVCALARVGAAGPLDETERWVPSLGITSGVLAQKADASVTSSPITYLQTVRSTPDNGVTEVVTTSTITNPNLRPPTSGDDVLVTPYVGGSAELMTPGLQSLWGRPRLFVRTDLSGAFGTERKVARERTPSQLPDPFPTEPYISEEGIPGIGSETTAEVQPFAIAAGAGVAFSLDLGGRRFRIKPSVEYSREEIDFTGAVIRAVNTDTGIEGQVNIQPKPSQWFGVTIHGDEKQVFQGVGAGLELEMDTVRAGPFMLSLFIDGRGVKILGDRKVEFSGQTTVSNPALIPTTNTFTADWEFEKKPWSFSGGVGIRFRWLPE